MLSLNNLILRGWVSNSKICLPWSCLYLPARILLFLVRGKPENIMWVIGDRLKLKSIVKLPDGNKLFFRPLTWDHEGIKEIYSYEDYETVFSPKRNDVVVDVGTHIGIFSVKAAKKVGKTGRVISVEPNFGNYTLLVNNKVLNNFSNITPVCGALSDHSGTAVLYAKKGHSGMFSIAENYFDSENVIVQVFTLDQVLAELNINRIDFLKIDAEGSEMPIIKGGAKILARSKARIVVAGYHPKDNPREIMSFLNSLGYNTRMGKNRFVYGWK